MRRAVRTALAAALAAAPAAAPVPAVATGPVAVVAAENFYGDVVAQVGGPEVRVASVLSNPDQDPHLFEASPSVARGVAGARLVVLNGIGYDPWMDKLLAAARGSGRQVIAVAGLVGRKGGDNPHVWYDPATMRALAQAAADALAGIDPAHRAQYRQRLARFQGSLRPVEARVAGLRARLEGTPVTATEPVFGAMFAALGMKVRNAAFQRAVMNGTEPAASDVAAFEDDLKARRVRLLVYNSQASDPTAERMRALAQRSGVPVVGATETEPPGLGYQTWMLSALDAVDRALPP